MKFEGLVAVDYARNGIAPYVCIEGSVPLPGGVKVAAVNIHLRADSAVADAKAVIAYLQAHQSDIAAMIESALQERSEMKRPGLKVATHVPAPTLERPKARRKT